MFDDDLWFLYVGLHTSHNLLENGDVAWIIQESNRTAKACLRRVRIIFIFQFSILDCIKILCIRVLCFIFSFQPADIYLIDEPSANLDSEQRIVAAKVIKRFILHAKKTAFVVEHDFIMATYLADKVIVYEGKPLVDCIANSPQTLLSGMNFFLSVCYNEYLKHKIGKKRKKNKRDKNKTTGIRIRK